MLYSPASPDTSTAGWVRPSMSVMASSKGVRGRRLAAGARSLFRSAQNTASAFSMAWAAWAVSSSAAPGPALITSIQFIGAPYDPLVVLLGKGQQIGVGRIARVNHRLAAKQAFFRFLYLGKNLGRQGPRHGIFDIVLL